MLTGTSIIFPFLITSKNKNPISSKEDIFRTTYFPKKLSKVTILKIQGTLFINNTDLA